jgi:hypothetical protein
VLNRAFPGRYQFVGDTCNANNISDAAIKRLAELNEAVLLLFELAAPAMCPRHERLALPLVNRHKAKVIHVFADELIEAAEFQRSIDQDNDYECEEWRTPKAEIVATKMQTPAPIETIGDVTDRAILVKPTIRVFGISREDKEVNAEVATQKGSDPAMTRFIKYILARESFAAIRAIESNARQEHYRRTVPWYDGGWRALAMGAYHDYTAMWRSYKAQWDPAVQDVLGNWDQIVAEGKKHLNGLAAKVKYSTREEAAKKFEFSMAAMPIPKSRNVWITSRRISMRCWSARRDAPAALG